MVYHKPLIKCDPAPDIFIVCHFDIFEDVTDLSKTAFFFKLLNPLAFRLPHTQSEERIVDLGLYLHLLNHKINKKIICLSS